MVAASAIVANEAGDVVVHEHPLPDREAGDLVPHRDYVARRLVTQH